MKSGTKRELIEAAAWGGSMLALAFAMVLARKLGYVEPETVTRVVIGSNGLMVAWYGNRMPKTWVPNAKAREARRVAAWSQVVSGLAYAGLWALAPLPVATVGGVAVILGGIVVTIGYCSTLRDKAKPTA